MEKVIIDPSNRMKYSSFYIKGLEEVFGKDNISFSTKYFTGLNRKTESHSFDHYMAFVLKDDNQLQKIIIDYRDKVTIKENAYEWCDKYAKINYNKEFTKLLSTEKIISIPPGFGIRIWGFWKTNHYCFINLARCNFSPLESFKAHFKDYFGLYLRTLGIESYYINNSFALAKRINDSDKKYIFSISTLWKVDNCITGTNLWRKKFIELCKNNNEIDFEGGFYSNTFHPQYEDFKDIIFTDRYPINEYIKKTKLSSFVFNTPAVLNCHGWKLGEFLAMGKAIISTPLLNELPKNLSHGENIHYISNDSELKNAINLLLINKAYRKKLESGAKTYYDEYVSPNSVIKYILDYKFIQPDF